MKTVAVDFDGVIHAYSQGWKDGSCYDVPMLGAEYGLKALLDRYSVFILSTRNSAQIVAWFAKCMPAISVCAIPDDLVFWNSSAVIGVTNRKLPARVYIDDRAYQFRSWATVVGDAPVLKDWPV